MKTEIASGKHGTTMAGFEGLAFAGQKVDQSMRLFVPAEPESKPKKKGREKKSAPGAALRQSVPAGVQLSKT